MSKTIRRVTVMAVKSELTMPNDKVTAKPRNRA